MANLFGLKEISLAIAIVAIFLSGPVARIWIKLTEALVVATDIALKLPGLTELFCLTTRTGRELRDPVLINTSAETIRAGWWAVTVWSQSPRLVRRDYEVNAICADAAIDEAVERYKAEPCELK
jgi:hypothetical protein